MYHNPHHRKSAASSLLDHHLFQIPDAVDITSNESPWQAFKWSPRGCLFDEDRAGITGHWLVRHSCTEQNNTRHQCYFLTLAHISDFVFWYHQLAVERIWLRCMQTGKDSNHPAGLSRTKQVEPWQLPKPARPLWILVKASEHRCEITQALLHFKTLVTFCNSWSQLLASAVACTSCTVKWCLWHIDFFKLRNPKSAARMAAEPSSNPAGLKDQRIWSVHLIHFDTLADKLMLANWLLSVSGLHSDTKSHCWDYPAERRWKT